MFLLNELSNSDKSNDSHSYVKFIVMFKILVKIRVEESFSRALLLKFALKSVGINGLKYKYIKTM